MAKPLLLVISIKLQLVKVYQKSFKNAYSKEISEKRKFIKIEEVAFLTLLKETI
ncbi:hypothetical protein [Elizabethkingia meningoseptica]|uniref:hypothetical protein n=1 Tax=Elizabethkingia meningoseptica TaxID=238 RepID=UPI003019C829